MSECPKITKIPKSNLYTFMCLNQTRNRFRCSENNQDSGKLCFEHFLTAVRCILMPKKRILTYISCFLMIL